MARTQTRTLAVRQTIPTIRIATPRMSMQRVSRPKGGTRRRSTAAGGGSYSPVQLAIAGAVIGKVEASGMLDKLPEIPVLGRKGTAAIIAHYWAKNGGGKMAKTAAFALAILAGYELGKTGSITGDDF